MLLRRGGRTSNSAGSTSSSNAARSTNMNAAVRAAARTATDCLSPATRDKSRRLLCLTGARNRLSVIFRDANQAASSGPVGNAVNVEVSKWLGKQLSSPQPAHGPRRGAAGAEARDRQSPLQVCRRGRGRQAAHRSGRREPSSLNRRENERLRTLAATMWLCCGDLRNGMIRSFT
jgi:hypothetical protein